jgi:hypothetical protein
MAIDEAYQSWYQKRFNISMGYFHRSRNSKDSQQTSTGPNAAGMPSRKAELPTSQIIWINWNSAWIWIYQCTTRNQFRQHLFHAFDGQQSRTPWQRNDYHSKMTPIKTTDRLKIQAVRWPHLFQR